MTVLEGKLCRGVGEGARFTRLDWVRRQCVSAAGIDPHPGTLNLRLEDASQRERWRTWRELPGIALEPATGFCSARCYPVRIAGCLPAAVVLPEVAAYPEDKVELIAALPVREHLSVREGDAIRLELCTPLAAKAVLFDIDGTLVDSMGAFLEVARIAARPYGIDVTQRQVRESLASGSFFWKGLVPAEHPDGKSVSKAMTAHASREWPRVLRDHGRVYEGLRETLEALKRAGLVLGIVSGARVEVLELLREAAVLEYFDAVVLAADVSHRKPHPEGILKCLRELDVPAEAAIYVGDTPIDIQASRAAGVRAVGVLTGAADSALLSAHGADRLSASHAGLPSLIVSSSND